MARGGRGGRGGRGRAPRKPVQRMSQHVEKDDMMYDEVDRHHNQKQALSMNVSDDAADSADDSALDDEAAVFDIAADDESSSEEDEEQALEEDIERGGRTAQMARTARELGMQLKKQEAEFGADDEDEEGEGEEGAADGKALWGASKRAYHGADAADASDDEDAAREEEEEAVRLQREAAAGLRPEDYADGLDLAPDDDDEGDSDAEDEEEREDEPRTMGGAADRGEAGGVEVEEVEKDLDSLDEQAQRAAVAADAPELGALLAELRANLAEVRTRVGPLVTEVRAGQLATAEGVSYLEAKNLLLLSYCTHIVFYLLLKAEGRPVRTHPVIGRLLQIRAYLEKLRPIDKKLQYQMDKLLRAAAQLQQPGNAAAVATANGSAAVPAAADPLSYGPNPDQLLPKVPLRGSFGGGASAADGAEEGLANGNGLYRPPRNIAVSMEDDPDRRRSAKERRQERDHGKRAKRSALLRELAQEVEGAPEEIGAAGAAAGMDSAQARRQLRQLEARAAAEEDLMMRVPLSKEQRKAVRAQRRAGMSGQALLDDFGDDVADLVDMANGNDRQPGNDGIDAGFRRFAVSQRYGGDLASAGLKGRSGDDDLPLREPLHERRAKYDAVRARQTAGDDSDADGDVLPGGAKRVREREIDDTYAAVAEATAAKKKARKAAHTAPALAPPLPDEEADGARGINQAIEKNRGLTPHRSKALKNPRKKHRIKFAQANVRRAGQVQPMREKSAGYGGEATGIKARISKSRRL